MSIAATSGRFAATHWTLVLRARGDTAPAKAALSLLCDSYYQPVLEFLRCEGRTQHASRLFLSCHVGCPEPGG